MPPESNMVDLFVDDTLNPHAFDADVRGALNDLVAILQIATQSGSAAIESTHFLVGLVRVRDGVTQRSLRKWGLSDEHWREGLLGCVTPVVGGLPVAHLRRNCFAESGLGMLETAANHRAVGDPRISEAMLLSGALAHLTPRVLELFRMVGIDPGAWRLELERQMGPGEPVPVFESTGERVISASFSPGARKLLRAAVEEAESLGHPQVDARHLLSALLGFDGGATQYGLHRQGVAPHRVSEALRLSLRRGPAHGRSEVTLSRAGLQRLVQTVLTRAGELAGRDGAPQVGEAHLLRAFLSVESTARRILEHEHLDLNTLQAVAEDLVVEEPQDEDEATVADIDTVSRRLRDRLVGQDSAIEQIVPYFELFRFGFNVQGRPVGVFLFCGPSGTGKTEMAKELARAVYGSEDNLIFLEMGHFSRPENVNEFVGAPPGYVGYGEGKLTNGLRDKPRSVVLFDEVEKAHPKVLHALLRFLDEGKIEDPSGPVRDGTQCIVVLTSNVGADDLGPLWDKYHGMSNGRVAMRRDLRELFRAHEFRTEFLNRVDEVILFRELTKEHYGEIAARRLGPVLEDLRDRAGIEVSVAPHVTSAIGAYCAVLGEGARPILRLVQSLVLLPAASFVARNRCERPVQLQVTVHVDPSDPSIEPVGVVVQT